MNLAGIRNAVRTERTLQESITNVIDLARSMDADGLRICLDSLCVYAFSCGMDAQARELSADLSERVAALQAVSRFHFVRDYREMVRALIASHPIDEAMSLAVGGSYDEIGDIELALLKSAGLMTGHHVVDVGCGSGRLSSAIFKDFFETVSYDGTDVVPELLDYARSRVHGPFRFHLVEDLTIPVNDGLADFVCFFSVFTHLLPEESYRLMREAKRVLKPGGHMMFSFLTYAEHWPIFMDAVAQDPAHLNTFLNYHDAWMMTENLGFTKIVDVPGNGKLGQRAMIVRNDRTLAEIDALAKSL